MKDFTCGFYAVNSDHCWLNNRCVVCLVSEADMQKAINYVAQARLDAYKYGMSVVMPSQKDDNSHSTNEVD